MKGFHRIDVDKNICFPAKINHLELIIQNHRLLERLVSFQTPMAWHQYSETELILIVFAMDTFISNVNGGRRIITESYLLSRYYLLKTWVTFGKVSAAFLSFPPYYKASHILTNMHMSTCVHTCCTFLKIFYKKQFFADQRVILDKSFSLEICL